MWRIAYAVTNNPLSKLAKIILNEKLNGGGGN
jgi:hypothetical protein